MIFDSFKFRFIGNTAHTVTAGLLKEDKFIITFIADGFKFEKLRYHAEIFCSFQEITFLHCEILRHAEVVAPYKVGFNEMKKLFELCDCHAVFALAEDTDAEGTHLRVVAEMRVNGGTQCARALAVDYGELRKSRHDGIINIQI